MSCDSISVYASIKALASKLVDERAWEGYPAIGNRDVVKKIFEHLLNLQDLEVSTRVSVQPPGRLVY